ncbi:MAG TPA: ricin-type beta-trefoil lectin domain protein [Actinocrinis sp.]|nr:ricin-type beta-trefoil lectin domain protein [Actinocrinis sp.]
MAAAGAAVFAAGPAVARPAELGASAAAVQATGTQRGPDPTIAMIEATRGPFATAQVSAPSRNGFGGGVVYYPTDTSLGTWGALAIVPGYSALCSTEEAWMGPWLSSFGFVVICTETNTRTDSDSQRAAELQAALTWLTTQSPVKSEVDPARLSVLGHSAGGAGAMEEAEQHPELRAAIGLAPGFPGQGLTLATDTVPTLIVGGQNDGTVTPSYLSNLYGTLPASAQSDFAQIAGADHVYYTHANNVEMKLIIPWLKVFVDSDTRYTQFLCPTLPDPSTISAYQPKCPYVPSGGSTPPPPTSVAIVGTGSGRCVTVPGGTQTGGTQVQLADCAGGTSQQWTDTAAGQLQVFGTSCLDANARGTSPGTKVIIWSCNGQQNQQWTVHPDGGITGVQSGLCLDATGAGTADGTPLELWTCNGGSNQKWTLR